MTKRASGRRTEVPRSGKREASPPYEKIAISLPSRAAEHVRRAVRNGEAKSVSAYITDAIEEKAKSESLAEMLDKMLEESGGPMTTAEARWADRKLGFARRSVAKKRKPK